MSVFIERQKCTQVYHVVLYESLAYAFHFNKYERLDLLSEWFSGLSSEIVIKTWQHGVQLQHVSPARKGHHPTAG